MSPTLNGSSVIRHFKRSDAIEKRDGITFDFYMGLPRVIAVLFQCTDKNHTFVLKVSSPTFIHPEYLDVASEGLADELQSVLKP